MTYCSDRYLLLYFREKLECQLSFLPFVDFTTSCKRRSDGEGEVMGCACGVVGRLRENGCSRSQRRGTDGGGGRRSCEGANCDASGGVEGEGAAGH